MSVVKQLFELSAQLFRVVNEENMDRDEQVHEIEQFLDHREQLMARLQPPYSSEEKELGQQLVKLNEQIDARLDQIKTQIKKDLHQIKVKKQSNRQYQNPYGQVSADGMFFDKRK
ncbi:flagellar protein FliT [Bacillus sp. HMF5848]|uniref:flagellar protein FliT n=1 Tax=Bacillus sp. HMF5848 TaxID=2495421 RepID=UPI000F7888FB|nr:flagellar protein FliT [Bacillus sp. HMF5848]RSK28607.1 flagellar protein FliT [Bacillus sp. HMF5848]